MKLYILKTKHIVMKLNIKITKIYLNQLNSDPKNYTTQNPNTKYKNSVKGELRAKFYLNFFFIYRFVYAYYNAVQNLSFLEKVSEVMTFLSFQDINKRDVTNAERERRC